MTGLVPYRAPRGRCCATRGSSLSPPVAAIAATHFVRRGRRVNDALDLTGARNPILLLLARVASACVGAFVGFALTAAVSLAVASFTGPSSTLEFYPLMVAAASVSVGALWGSVVGIAWPKPWAPVAAAAAVYVLSQIQSASSDGVRFSWPTVRLHVYETVSAAHYLAFAAFLTSAALVVFAVITSRRGSPTGDRSSRLAKAVTLTVTGAFMVAAVGWVAALNPAQARQLVPAEAAHCVGSSPKVCVWPDNASTAESAQRALATAHAVLGTWPANIDSDAPRFVEMGIDRTDNGDVITASPLDYWGSRLGGELRPSFLNIANNWTTATACGTPRTIDSTDVQTLLNDAYSGPVNIEQRRTALTLPTQCS